MVAHSLKKRIQNRLVLSISIPLVVIIVLMLIFYYQSLKNHTFADNKTTTILLTNYLINEIKQAEDRLTTLALLLDQDILKNPSESMFIEKIIQNQANLEEIRLLDSKAYVYMVVPYNPEITGFDMSGEVFVKTAVSEHKPSWSAAYLSPITKLPSASLAVPFDRGIIVASFSFTTLNWGAAFGGIGTKSDLKVSIIDKGGIFIAHTDNEKVLKREWTPMANLLRQKLLAMHGTDTVTIDNNSWLMTGSLVSETGWIVVLYQAKSSITEPIWRLSLMLALISLVLVSMGVYLSFRTSSKFFSYFHRLTSKIHEVAGGTYHHEMPTEGYQELQEVAVDFYKMTREIKARQNQVNSLNLELESRLSDAKKAIEEQKQTEAELKVAHERFLTVLDGISSTIYVADMETYEILFMNKHMKTLFGNDFTGHACWKVFRKKTHPCENCTNKQLVDANNTPTGVCIWEDTHPVTARRNIYHDSAIKWVNGRMVRLQIATDITHLKEMEKKQTEFAERLQQAQKMESIGTLAGGIAHDFNNILSAILGYTEIALEEIPENSKLSLYIKEVMRAGERARDLVNQILTFSRKQDQNLKPLLISLVIKEALRLLRSSIPSTIKIIKYIDPNCGLVLADPTQIHQVMMNLCTNAYHAMRETGGVLNVSLRPVEYSSMDALTDKTDLIPGPYLELTISDTGSGISKKNLERIFEPYFTTKEKGEGTGLGLAVVHGIVKSYHGEIKVNSEPGKGTVFRVFLPVIKQVQPFDFKKETEPLPKGNERILFVDDDANLAMVSQIILETLGYKTTILTSSLLALDTFKSNPDDFDLLITDMTMPDMTGEQLSRKIFEIRPGMPIILCSGYSEKINSKNAEAMGIQGYLAKPVLKKDMAKMVRKVLDNTKTMVDKSKYEVKTRN